jgi:hypothetical protein
MTVAPPLRLRRMVPLDLPGLAGYRDRWREMVSDATEAGGQA